MMTLRAESWTVGRPHNGLLAFACPQRGALQQLAKKAPGICSSLPAPIARCLMDHSRHRWTSAHLLSFALADGCNTDGQASVIQ